MLHIVSLVKRRLLTLYHARALPYKVRSGAAQKSLHSGTCESGQRPAMSSRSASSGPIGMEPTGPNEITFTKVANQKKWRNVKHLVAFKLAARGADPPFPAHKKQNSIPGLGSLKHEGNIDDAQYPNISNQFGPILPNPNSQRASFCRAQGLQQAASLPTSHEADTGQPSKNTNLRSTERCLSSFPVKRALKQKHSINFSPLSAPLFCLHGVDAVTAGLRGNGTYRAGRQLVLHPSKPGQQSLPHMSAPDLA